MTRQRFAACLLVLASLLLLASSLSAQSKPAPRLPNGKPDFSGVWDHPRVGDITKDATGNCAGATPGCSSKGNGPLEMTPVGKIENEKEPRFDYGMHCLPWGYIRSTQTPYPHAYMQNNEKLVIMWEQDNLFHVVPTDGRAHSRDLEPTWFGDSVGKWDGDTLVIDTIGFNGKTWIDTAEHMHSDQLHVVERMTRTDYDHIKYELTVEDKKYYTKPITNTRTFVLMKPGQEILEYSCEENNKEINEGFYQTNNPLKK